METTSELRRICKHIATNKLTEDQIFDLFEKHQNKVYKLAWERGWRIRSRASDRAREARLTAEKKIQDQEQERTEDPPEPLNFSKVIKKGVLIPLPNGDEKPVEFLTSGDQIIYNEEIKEVKDAMRVNLKWQVTLTPHICMTPERIAINTKRRVIMEVQTSCYPQGCYYFNGKFVKLSSLDDYLEPYEGKQKDDYIVFLK